MKKNTIIVGLVGLAVLGALVLSGAYISSAQAQDTTSGLVASDPTVSTTEASVLAAKFIQQVNILQGINIAADSKVLDSAAFKSLVDFSRPIPDEAAGRDNPFAPF